MSQIFYSEIDKNLQKELDARARAGKSDRSETALRYMTEKIANVSVTAYEGNKRDKDKIVHTLGGRNVIGEEYMPGGPNGFLTDRVYTLGESRWTSAAGTNAKVPAPSKPVPFSNFLSNPIGAIIQTSLDDATRSDIQETTIADATNKIKTETKTNTSKRIPPFITQAILQINDNSKATTNKVTINITIPNPDRDLNFMESVYARPGRYCMVQFEHPDSALMTRNVTGVNGKLLESTLPARDLIKKRYPDAEYDELRKMNKLQFEGLITAFEYAFNQDGTVTMTVYVLGTSQTYTDLSMIMQTAATGSSSNNNGITLGTATTFYTKIYNEIKSRSDRQLNPDASLGIDYAFGEIAAAYYNEPGWWIWNHTSLSGKRNNYISLNYLVNLVNENILSKLKSIVATPLIYSDTNNNCYSNQYPALVSNDPDNILLTSAGAEIEVSDSYGIKLGNQNANKEPKQWLEKPIPAAAAFYDSETESFGRTGNIFINLEIIDKIAKQFDLKPDEFNVGNFFKEIGLEINNATSGAINLKLITDPEDLTILYYRDINWIKNKKTKPPKPYLLPMFANDTRGTVVRDFKLTAKLPSQVQSLMYAINSTDKVTESQLGPYINFMYNNGTSTRTPTEVINQNGKTVIVDELTTYGGGKELTERLAKQYAALHDKYYNELMTARSEFGNEPTSVTKQQALRSALTKHLQYPEATIQKTNQVAAPTFPIEAEFTIDGINGLRYGDILDFPGIPAKYRTNSTFTIKGITHTISNSGEWTTQVSCLMRPKFD
jgi:hypothetical protein